MPTKTHFEITYRAKDGSEDIVLVDQPSEDEARAAVMDIWDFEQILSVTTAPTCETAQISCQGYALRVHHNNYDLSWTNVIRVSDQVFSTYPDLDKLRDFLNCNLATILDNLKIVQDAAKEIEEVTRRYKVNAPIKEMDRRVHAGIRITEFCNGLIYQVTGKGPASFTEVIHDVRITPEGIFIPLKSDTLWRVDIQP